MISDLTFDMLSEVQYRNVKNAVNHMVEGGGWYKKYPGLNLKNF